ncbi:hypothetical protein CROQUDRAFT_495919 [Cronartium quercuum f. sp. fusiforme G11]|uniref:Uncharacterized protein n=1 Tax=Cronartium quercuum f. sp. fusiforme G11 TaxID=708437 RepID=A0A9P6NH16_9BASI|nr:hypothetical protein CROQUDRAFT_495919 [Cronartium quercuum f. sp. fusiforme G11]
MLVLSYPRAPTLRKLDTPLCDYDGTPIGLGSIHPAAHSVYYHAGYLQDTTAAIGSLAISNFNRPSMARKSSLGRVIIDEALAKQLGVSYTAPSLPSSSSSSLSQQEQQQQQPSDHVPCPPPSINKSTTDSSEPSTISLSMPHLTRDRNALYNSDSLSQPPTSFTNTSSSGRTPQIQRPNLHHQTINLSTSKTTTSSDDPLSRSRTQPIDQNQISPTLLRRASEPTHPQPYERQPEPAKFIPSPSNRHMGFSSTASREVVPTHSSPTSSSKSTPDPLLQVSLIALESIWPHYSSDPPVIQSLLYFIKEVLRRSRTNPNTLKIGLFYLHQARRLIRDRLALAEESEPLDDPVLSGRKMFLAALMCASKYLQDCNFSNRAWAKISGLPIQDVNANERVFLTLVDYRLHVDLHAFEVCE